MRNYYLFYLLTIVLLVFGFLTRDVQAVDTTWGTSVIHGMWSFFVPFAIGAFFVGAVYHFCSRAGRPVNGGIIIFHFVLVSAGLLFSYNIYRMSTVIISDAGADTYAVESAKVPFYMFLPGPVLLIASFVVFVFGLMRARRKTVI
jgi:hypothetical protein